VGVKTLVAAVVLSHEPVVEHVWTITNLLSTHAMLLPFIIMALILNVECFVSTLDVDLLHVLESLVHQHILNVLHVPILGTFHYFTGNFWVLFEDLSSEEPLTQGNGFNISSCEVDEL
jgi:hypothetical protein